MTLQYHILCTKLAQLGIEGGDIAFGIIFDVLEQPK